MPMLLSLLVMAAMVFAIVDIILRDNWQVKHLPKFVWLMLVILLPLLGTVLWFAIGREWPERDAAVGRVARQTTARPAGHVPPPPLASSSFDTRTTEQQLADLEKEIEEERLRAELRRRQAERGDD